MYPPLPTSRARALLPALRSTLPPALLFFALAVPLVALADTPAEIKLLRHEIESIRASYDARLQALEQRLKAAEATAASSALPAAPALITGVAPSVAPSAKSSPATVTTSANANAFNPAISLILSGLYTRTSQTPVTYAITGFPRSPAAEIGPGTRGFSLAESELNLAASIDPWWRGSVSIALHPDDTVSVEEAFVQTTALGNGLSVKAGRFFSGVGYLNARHAHTWDFVDNPLAYQALLGTQYAEDGVQVTWLAPSDQFVQLGAEIGRGRGFPGADNSRNGAGMTALTAHTGGDFGDSHSWRAGLSLLNAKAEGQELLGLGAASNAATHVFSGRTRVWVADAIWKWAPHGNASRTSFTLQGEYLRSARSGSLVFAADASDSAYRSVQSGWYVQGIYQFMPRWRLGLRSERLNAGTPDDGRYANPYFERYATSGYRPRKTTLMVDFSTSEFSRVRLQLAQDRARLGRADKQLFLQYQMSLGAHGAHRY